MSEYRSHREHVRTLLNIKISTISFYPCKWKWRAIENNEININVIDV